MAKKRVGFAGDRHGKDFIRSKNVLMVLTVLCCGSCSMWLLWLSGGSGILEKIGVRDLRNPVKQMLFDRFNSSTDQLQALALLMSSLDQGRFFECMNKSVADDMLGSSLRQTLEELNSEMDRTRGQQGLIGRQILRWEVFNSSWSRQLYRVIYATYHPSKNYAFNEPRRNVSEGLPNYAIRERIGKILAGSTQSLFWDFI